MLDEKPKCEHARRRSNMLKPDTDKRLVVDRQRGNPIVMIDKESHVCSRYEYTLNWY
jgi:hypothetical protein